jgi:transmembrane sensor
MNRQSKWKREDRQRLAERAAEWLDVLEHANDEERTEFAEWLIASPRHAEEALFVTALGEELKKARLRELPSVRKLMNEAAENIVPLADMAAIRRPTPSTRRSGALGLAAAVVLAVAGALWWISHRAPAYTTSVGEQRTIQLEDGSTVVLNTLSRVSVHYSDELREIQLLEGEALFAVHEDATRPFRVMTDDAIVQALGTQFNVDRHRSGTTVSVVEGKVSVAPTATRGDGKKELSAGEEARVSEGRRVIKRVGEKRIAQAVAWRNHQLVFLSDTLVDIASEFNRYNRAPRLVVEDRIAGAKRYSGVFAAGDPRSLIDFLKEDPRLVLEEKGEEIQVRANGQVQSIID